MRKKNPELMKKIKNYIDEYFLINKKGPSLREISEKLNVGKTTVHRYLYEMTDKGILEYNGLNGFNTEVTRRINGSYTMVAILGNISCGIPKYAHENIESYIEMPKRITGEGSFYALRAYGDSMKGVNINHGDYVLIRQENTAEEGDIVVALVEDEVTLKTYYLDRENNRIRLHPENDKYDDIFLEHVIIQGIAIKVFKDLNSGKMNVS